MGGGQWSNGVEVVGNPVNRRVKSRKGEAPAEPPNAGPRSGQLPANSRSSGDQRSPRGKDAAQQGLRAPGAPFYQKVKVSDHFSGRRMASREAAKMRRGSHKR